MFTCFDFPVQLLHVTSSNSGIKFHDQLSSHSARESLSDLENDNDMEFCDNVSKAIIKKHPYFDGSLALIYGNIGGLLP